MQKVSSDPRSTGLSGNESPARIDFKKLTFASLIFGFILVPLHELGHVICDWITGHPAAMSYARDYLLSGGETPFLGLLIDTRFADFDPIAKTQRIAESRAANEPPSSRAHPKNHPASPVCATVKLSSPSRIDQRVPKPISWKQMRTVRRPGRAPSAKPERCSLITRQANCIASPWPRPPFSPRTSTHEVPVVGSPPRRRPAPAPGP